ncbi:hypothetical protein Tco_0232988 [Tanacetum coccineum]
MEDVTLYTIQGRQNLLYCVVLPYGLITHIQEHVGSNSGKHKNELFCPSCCVTDLFNVTVAPDRISKLSDLPSSSLDERSVDVLMDLKVNNLYTSLGTHDASSPIWSLVKIGLKDTKSWAMASTLCYPTNDSENLGKLQPKADIDFDELTIMASEQSSSGPALHERTPATISSGLVPNDPPLIPFVPPSRTDWDMLFQPLFDELLTPPPSVDHPALEVIAPIAEVSSSRSQHASNRLK